jgi:hypothetical protein
VAVLLIDPNDEFGILVARREQQIPVGLGERKEERHDRAETSPNRP